MAKVVLFSRVFRLNKLDPRLSDEDAVLPDKNVALLVALGAVGATYHLLDSACFEAAIL